MGYAQSVLKALTETEELAVLLDEDLDVENGGFSWWHSYGLDLGVHTEITGRLMGVVTAVSTNLRTAASHLHDYREARHADDQWILERANSGAIPPTCTVQISKPGARPGSPHTAPVSSAQQDPSWTPSLAS